MILLLALIPLFNGYAQTLDPARAVDWRLAGYRGSLQVPVHWVDFLSAGGVADGLTPNDSVLAGILDTLSDPATVIFFPQGEYLFRHPVSISKSVRFAGVSAAASVLKFDLQEEDHCIKIQGNATGTESPLTAGVSKDSVVLEVADAGAFLPGEIIEIMENDSALVTSSWALNTTGQINRIDSIAGNRIFLHSPMRRSFDTVHHAKIIRIAPVEEVFLESLKIERMDTTIQQTSNVFFNYARNCRIKCVESIYCNYAHINVCNSTGIEISGCFIHEAFGYGDGGKAYGVMLESASGECLVTGNIFDHLRHSMILQAGSNGNVFAYNYSRNPYWTDVTLPANSAGDIVLHGNFPYCNLFEGNICQNIVIDDSHGANGMFNTFFRNRAELYGIFMNTTTPTNDQNFIGNEIPNTGLLLGLYFLSGTGHFEYGNNVKGTITPAGTTNLPEASLYLDTVPEYYQSFSVWPPIGLPNPLNAYSTAPRDHYLAGIMTVCNDTVAGFGIPEMQTQYGFRCVPNPTSGRLEVIPVNGEARMISSIEVLTLTGRLLQRTSNTAVVDLGRLSDGLYLLKVTTDDGCTTVIKVIKIP